MIKMVTPSYFRMKPPAAREFHLSTRQWSRAKIGPAPNILDQISPEGNLRMDLRRRYITALCWEQWRKTAAVSNTKAAPAPTEYYLKDPFTFTTESIKTTRDGAFYKENMVWLLIAEMLCLLRCESKICWRSLNCKKSGRVVARFKERKNERRKATKDQGWV